MKPTAIFDNLTEASNLLDELYEKAEIENEQQYRTAPDKIESPKKPWAFFSL